MYLTCKCGHLGEWEDFDAGIKDGFRCPACGMTWRVVTVGEGEWLACGLYVPPERKVVVLKEGHERL